MTTADQFFKQHITTRDEIHKAKGKYAGSMEAGVIYQFPDKSHIVFMHAGEVALISGTRLLRKKEVSHAARQLQEKFAAQIES